MHLLLHSNYGPTILTMVTTRWKSLRDTLIYMIILIREFYLTNSSGKSFPDILRYGIKTKVKMHYRNVWVLANSSWPVTTVNAESMNWKQKRIKLIMTKCQVVTKSPVKDSILKILSSSPTLKRMNTPVNPIETQKYINELQILKHLFLALLFQTYYWQLQAKAIYRHCAQISAYYYGSSY